MKHYCLFPYFTTFYKRLTVSPISLIFIVDSNSVALCNAVVVLSIIGSYYALSIS